MRTGVVVAALMVLSARASTAWAAGADAVQRAAEHFDEGSRAFQAQRFEQAASHFEAAFSAVPNARVLRVAMRARDAAGQADRAATLAALAHARYADEPETTQFASELLAKHAGALAALNVRCLSPCVVAVDGRVIPGGVDAQHSVYVSPAKVRVAASFARGGEAEVTIDARRGAAHDLELAPPEEDSAPASPPPPPRAVAAPAPPSRPPAASERPETPSAKAPRSEAERADARASRSSRNRVRESSWYESRGLFATAMVATAGVGGVAIWSGIDTLRDPGKDGVRAACAGLGTSCPSYQRGLEKQLRTNILIGATGGTALVTLLIGALATNFSPDAAPNVGLVLEPERVGLTWARTF